MRAKWREVVPDRTERAERLLWQAVRCAGLIVVTLLIAKLFLDGLAPIAFYLSLALAALVFWPIHPTIRQKRLAALRDEPSTIRQHEVDVYLYREGLLYARDSGVVSFVDDWLVYTGIGTDFSVPSILCQAASDAKLACGECRPPKGPTWMMRLNGNPELFLCFAARRFPHHFEIELQQWNQRKRPVAGTPVWPPVMPQEFARQRAKEVQANAMVWLFFAVAIYFIYPYRHGLSFDGFLSAAGNDLSLTSTLSIGYLLIFASRWRPAVAWQQKLERFTLEALSEAVVPATLRPPRLTRVSPHQQDWLQNPPGGSSFALLE